MIGKVRCAKCGGKGGVECDGCLGPGWTWADGAPPTFCPAKPGEAPSDRCGRRDGLCHACGRAAAEFPTPEDIARTREIAKRLTAALTREITDHVQGVTYEDARALLTPDEFREFDAGCVAMGRYMRLPDGAAPGDEDRRLLDRMGALRQLAASRRAIQ